MKYETGEVGGYKINSLAHNVKTKCIQNIFCVQSLLVLFLSFFSSLALNAVIKANGPQLLDSLITWNADRSSRKQTLPPSLSLSDTPTQSPRQNRQVNKTNNKQTNK